MNVGTLKQMLGGDDNKEVLGWVDVGGVWELYPIVSVDISTPAVTITFSKDAELNTIQDSRNRDIPPVLNKDNGRMGEQSPKRGERAETHIHTRRSWWRIK